MKIAMRFLDDCAFGPLSGSTSQPNLQSVVAMLEDSPRATELEFDKLMPFDSYWEAVRSEYRAFDRGPRYGSAEVYEHEIPGGQYTNLRTQAVAMGLGEPVETGDLLITLEPS